MWPACIHDWVRNPDKGNSLLLQQRVTDPKKPLKTVATIDFVPATRSWVVTVSNDRFRTEAQPYRTLRAAVLDTVEAIKLDWEEAQVRALFNGGPLVKEMVEASKAPAVTA
jgi:hypothetical protein